ncbi:unnamed protein product, partial [marine sediment metagenome]
MKLGRVRTLRGQIDVVAGVARKNIIVSDGLVNYGLKIKSFTLWIDNFTLAHTMQGILSYDTISSGAVFNAGDNRQFGWTFYANSGAIGEVTELQSIIDPDHIVNRDLFLTMFASTPATYNYLIEAQVVELSDEEAIITIIKETSQ